ncbi:S1 RNA-binding domain-containing protein [Anaerosalibacter bizertensis]|uniref:CvfB family protein n=1 Tax=Anaerosalibacter bizertensis TaxID=932217 RepID=UPI00176DD58D|nr:S1-like domain-containing RNA-binding protein [Anaerosalibacter bizertensis]MBU5292496.1 S1 RNA-binding domain-containing protein [Anaerosalibacter bizertensis]MCB5558538.1 S1 RNA-binding domain-containing protein [Anaerosalibacter bizertensis]MCG4584867.1 S1-like domain-containing RNA-binding protein [Anaerosalibacter bizertensis]HHV26167.1 S1 RNA-binding domain-containing protein [Tissierellia bacterium]
MIEIGKIQKLEVVKITQSGLYLNTKDEKNKDDIFLPKKEMPKDTKEGNMIEVFIYKGTKNEILATTKKPKLTVGEIGLLRVVQNTKIGAFLDWGIDKDLFLPFTEQIGKVEKGREYLVGVYIDKSNRPCATMKIKNILSSKSPYKENDRVKGTIYGINHDMGAFVAVDNKYDGLIPKNELYGIYKIGDEVEVRVTMVRVDGKLNLSLRKKSYKQMDRDATRILKKLRSNNGELGLNDNSSPEKIYRELNMSKSAFKRAVGRLLKERQIEFTKKGIRIKR